MYFSINSLHSLVQWILMLSLLITLYRAYRGWLYDRSFTRLDSTVSLTTVTFASVQLLIGTFLNFTGPISDLLEDFQLTPLQKVFALIAMKDSLLMITAIVLLTIGTVKAFRKKEESQKFTSLTVWFTIALVIIIYRIN